MPAQDAPLIAVGGDRDLSLFRYLTLIDHCWTSNNLGESRSARKGQAALDHKNS